MFFAAHPDDAELCCGGTIAALINNGKTAGIVDLTKGELGTRGSVSIRKKESELASKVLGISTRNNLGIPDGNIQNNPANRLKIIKVIRQYRPQVIFLPHFYDRHPDHYNTHILVKEAAFYAGLDKIITKGYKAFRPGRNFYYMQTYAFEPDVIMDISDTYETKIKAVICYSSQFYTDKQSSKRSAETFISSKSFMEFVEARAKFYGFSAGVKYGEAFCTEEKIKLTPYTLFKI